VASNLKLHHLDNYVPTHRCRKKIGGKETSPLTLLFSLSPITITDDDDDDDNDVDE